jgi:hypothetical protein
MHRPVLHRCIHPEEKTACNLPGKADKGALDKRGDRVRGCEGGGRRGRETETETDRQRGRERERERERERGRERQTDTHTHTHTHTHTERERERGRKIGREEGRGEKEGESPPHLPLAPGVSIARVWAAAVSAMST